MCYRALAFSEFEAGNLAEAERIYRKALELAPKTIIVRAALGLILFERGRSDEALASVREEPAAWIRLQNLALLHHKMGHPAESEATLQELMRDHGRDAFVQIASVYANRGEADPAFEWLERAYANRDPGVFDVIRSKRFLPGLQTDPRWPVFLRKLGLEP
jgi:tetratricopeptide (TPR) repeat protein